MFLLPLVLLLSANSWFPIGKSFGKGLEKEIFAPGGWGIVVRNGQGLFRGEEIFGYPEDPRERIFEAGWPSFSSSCPPWDHDFGRELSTPKLSSLDISLTHEPSRVPTGSVQLSSVELVRNGGGGGFKGNPCIREVRSGYWKEYQRSFPFFMNYEGKEETSW